MSLFLFSIQIQKDVEAHKLKESGMEEIDKWFKIDHLYVAFVTLDLILYCCILSPSEVITLPLF